MDKKAYHPAADFLVFGSPRIEEDVIAEVAEVLRSGWLGSGPKCKAFEEAFAAYLGVEQALAVNSGTAALHLGLLALGIGPGDEVITSPMTFCATANVIVHTGATPVFADVDPLTWNLDPARVEAKITARTRAVLPVHYLGRPCDVRALDEIGRKHGLFVIYDAAHAIEAQVEGRSVVSWGDVSCFSFHATKNITTGEGGMLVSNRPEVLRRAAVLRQHGLDVDAWTRFQGQQFGRYLATSAGFKYSMPDLNAAIGLKQLARIEEWYSRRAAIWLRYSQALADLPLQLPAPVEKEARHACHLFTPLVHAARTTLGRDDVIDGLRSRRIGTGIHFIGLHDHPFYRDCYGLRREDYPNSASISDRTFSLPLSSKLTNEQVETVIEALHDVFL